MKLTEKIISILKSDQVFNQLESNFEIDGNIGFEYEDKECYLYTYLTFDEEFSELKNRPEELTFVLKSKPVPLETYNWKNDQVILCNRHFKIVTEFIKSFYKQKSGKWKLKEKELDQESASRKETRDHLDNWMNYNTLWK